MNIKLKHFFTGEWERGSGSGGGKGGGGHSGGAEPNYALWLVPTEASLAQATAQDRQLAEAVRALKANGEWGGQVHITLTSFVGAAGCPDTRGNVHGDSLVEAAKQLANANATTATRWTGGGSWGRSGPSGPDAAFYNPGASRTLTDLTKRLKATGLFKPRGRHSLHATFRGMRQFPNNLPALNTLEWEVAVVQDRNPDDEQHCDIRIKDHERFGLLSRTKMTNA